MRAIVPLNVAALRVSNADSTDVTPGSGFAGSTAAFDLLPHGRAATQASTGDTVWRGLEDKNPPANALETGVHLHWELPEYFKRGRHDPDLGAITFPPAPTRWLVVRSLSLYEASSHAYGAAQHTAWVVESDYLAATLSPDCHHIVRPAVAVPLPALDGAPFMYMGRVVEAAAWDPAGEQPQDYLPSRRGADGAALYLTSIGFVGAAFSGYYPDCRSVFGFWDTFADIPAVHNAISANAAIKFRASYDVIGWLAGPADDPLNGLASTVTREYERYVAQCAAEQVDVASTPTKVFQRIAAQSFGWEFSANAIAYTLAADKKLASLIVPEATLCAGVIQDVVWDASDPTLDTPFLAPAGKARTWTDEVEIAVGNTTVEAVSALVKSQLSPPGGTPLLADYEVLLDALQLGLLRDLEPRGNALVTLERARHAKAFSQIDGGHVWTIQTKAAPGSASSAQLTLPLTLAEQLDLLDNAQQAYDQGRARLVTIRQQLFMDWVIYVKQLAQRPPGQYVVDTNALSAFLATGGGGGELHAVIDEGSRVGLLHYKLDPDSERIVGVSTDDGASTLAGQVLAAYQTVAAELAKRDGEWELDAVPAAPFWLPTSPVLVMEGKRLEPVQRNGPDATIAVRADSELITTLTLAGASTWSVAAAELAGLPAPPAGLGTSSVAVAALLGEAALLDPLYVAAVAAATGAPDASTIATAIAGCQGGQSPLDPPVSAGLYAAIRADGAVRSPNPRQTVSAPEALTVTFTNAAKTALAPDPVAWNAQTALRELSATRVDPYLPVWLTWQVRLDPLARGADADYERTTLSERFGLDTDAIDLDYPLPARFTTGQPLVYQGAVVLSKKPYASLTQQIDAYIAEFPQDAADPELSKARADLAGRKVLSQSLDTFDLAQTLRTTIPQIPVADLVVRPDLVTASIAAAANATAGDRWYDTAFNALTAISSGLPAQRNFGPLRAGFLEILMLATVDVFGQVMQLETAQRTDAGALRVTPSIDLSPLAGDSANAGKIYLPPRMLAPSRPDAHWLSATHNDEVAGVEEDFVEVNDHPATSPVCGWIMPNHLDVTLEFYDADGSAIGSFVLEHDADGSAIGSFGLEHDAKANVYRTRAGNTANPDDELALDIGQPGTPSVNAHTAALMWFINGRPATFLADLMATIERSDKFINPVNFAQDVALSVLIGRPLAIARTVHSLSSAGGVLPVSQANTSAADALAQTVSNSRYEYAERQAHTCAGLDRVVFPVRLGELTDVDDGLVAFLPEAASASPYTTMYSPAAPQAGANGVVRPRPDTIELTLNGPALTFTTIVDPRAPVHVTTGVLPTVSLQIPPDQYMRAMHQLAVSFTTRPVLRDQRELTLPLPAETGFAWWWVPPGQPPAPLGATGAPDAPVYGYSPQRLLEGWLELARNPDTTDSEPA